MVQQLSTSSIDKLQRFTFDDYDLHGGIIHTVNSFSQLFAKHSYPKCVKELLGQLQCAVCLISDTLKVFGEITIQIRSHGRLKYALVKVNENFETIGLADIEGNITDNEAFTDIISKDAVLLITFAPLDGENYQCIVPLDKPSLAECIEDYYRQSIQVACQMKLFTNADLTHSSGMIITAIPTKRDKAMQLLHFEHITTLSDTITEEEMHTLSFNEIL